MKNVYYLCKTIEKMLQAKFTKFEKDTNWCDGIVGDGEIEYKFQAKLFDNVSTYGINNGRVSKLSIWDEEKRHKLMNFGKSCIVSYDRGWDIEPSEEFQPYLTVVMDLLENSPKRFS
jgi:hypothetical protein